MVGVPDESPSSDALRKAARELTRGKFKISFAAAPRAIGPYLEGVLVTILATALGAAVNTHVGLPNISLVSVVPVLVAAARHGLVPSLWVSALSVLSYNFFFLPPLYQFSIADPANVVALFFLMFVAVATSALGTRTRAQAQAARREAH